MHLWLLTSLIRRISWSNSCSCQYRCWQNPYGFLVLERIAKGYKVNLIFRGGVKFWTFRDTNFIDYVLRVLEIYISYKMISFLGINSLAMIFFLGRWYVTELLAFLEMVFFLSFTVACRIGFPSGWSLVDRKNKELHIHIWIDKYFL